MKTPLVLALLALLAAPGLGQGMPPASIETGVVIEEDVQRVVTGVATVEPWLRTVLGAEVSGRVHLYPLREGDAVEKDKTVVCRIETSLLAIDLEEAKALLQRAEAEAGTAVETARASMEERRALMERAERDLVRAQALFEKNVVSEAERDQAESDATAARFQFQRAEQTYKLAVEGTDPAALAREAEVRRAKARLERVQDLIAKASIKSPVTGRVVRRHTEVGAWLATGAPVVEIVVLDPVLVRIGVNEKDIAIVRRGDTATIRVDAHPDRSFEGTVRYVVPEADARTRSFPVLIEVKNAKTELLAGMFARVELRVGPKRRALTVPKDAIVRGPMGTMIYTLGPAEGDAPHTAAPIPVKTGVSVRSRIVVEGKGLAPGMPVITTGNEKLRPGQGVAPPPPAGDAPPGEGDR